MNTEYIDIYIDGVKLPTPSKIDVEYADMDADSIRPISNGILKRNRIRANVQKINISYLLKDIADIDKIMTMIKPVMVSVKLYDSAAGGVVTKQMYAGNKTFSYLRLSRTIKGQSFQFSLTEA